MKPTSPLRKAIEIVGSQNKLAKILGKRQSVIWAWLKRGTVSAEYVLKVEQATGGRVTRHELRPDLYPKEDQEESTTGTTESTTLH
uniref:Uncharacterized protein n=1 Tax=Leptospirillum ferrodiazotrophum TaxID=412449 RepID=C6HVZ4_9BACT|nr:MAG: hypothetical protein UBAL3_80150045 [Leptospirillum ferrodiazotrophum]